jgi:hypothetical protein
LDAVFGDEVLAPERHVRVRRRIGIEFSGRQMAVVHSGGDG